jgi:hypothetical protein
VEVIKYSDVLRRVVSFAQRVYSELNTDDAEAISVYLDTRLKKIWETYPWPDLVRVEKRTFRGIYNASTTYAAGAEVYYPSEEKYYQALRSTTGNLPTVLTHWAEAKQSYAPATWVTGTAYAVGDTVEYDPDGLYYACHTAHTAGANLASNWGQIIEFDKYVAWKQSGENEIADVLDVWNANPRTANKADQQNYYQSENGVQVINGPNIVYIEYRQLVPSLLHSAWVVGTVYATDEVVRYPASGADFDLYKANSVHTASGANGPADAGSLWTLIQIPRDFRSYLAHGAAADILLADEREQLGGVQNSLGEKALNELLGKLERQEKQTKQMNVVNR